MRLLVDFLCISSSSIFFFTWIMNEIKYCRLDIKKKIVFFPLDTTLLILPIICFFHSCVIMVAHIHAQLVHSGPLLSVYLDNPISCCPGNSCICILLCAIPVFLCTHCWGSCWQLMTVAQEASAENITKKSFLRPKLKEP